MKLRQFVVCFPGQFMTNVSFFTINITARYMKTVAVKSRHSYQIKFREILT